MNDTDETDDLTDSVREVTGNKPRRKFMIRFRASGLLAIYFFIQTWYAFEAHSLGNVLFNLIVALCLVACWIGRPLHILDFIEFGGW